MSDSAKDLEKILKALANRRRIEIVRYIRAKQSASVSDIAEEVKLSFKGISKNLRLLYAAGILEREQKGAQAIYLIAKKLPDITRKALHLL